MTSHNNLHTVLFNATSAEYYALTTQAYKLARHATIERLNEGTFTNPAIVFDLDETVLDNSPYQAWLISKGYNYHDDTWNKWCDTGSADAVPGAIEFIRFVRENGIEPIFITSRRNSTRRGTAENLHRLELLADDELSAETTATLPADHALKTRLFMKDMTSVDVARPSGLKKYDLKNKYMQRVFCEEVRGFEIILSVGDNLSDYAEYYGSVLTDKGETTKKHPSAASRRAAARQDAQLFGRDFILIPNPTYGGWLRAFEAEDQLLGASDEIAYTPALVREALNEPQADFIYDNGQKTVKAKGPKLSEANLRIWTGPTA
jgi:predicted secreted acid phosphatase